MTPPTGAAKILAWAAAGIVEAVGAEVTDFMPGDAFFYAGALSTRATCLPRVEPARYRKVQRCCDASQ